MISIFNKTKPSQALLPLALAVTSLSTGAIQDQAQAQANPAIPKPKSSIKIPLKNPAVPEISITTRSEDLMKEAAANPKMQGTVNLRIVVPQMKGAIDTFNIYPYPVKPPRITTPIKPLSVDDEQIVGVLMQIGYLNREKFTNPYPMLGRRYQYCYVEALRKYGGWRPHTIVTFKPWCQKMVPYILPEIMKSNEIEADRKVRYNKAMQEWEQNHMDLENDATRLGLESMPIKMRANGEGTIKVPPGSWWVSGNRKVPGLVYYWQMPVTLTAGDTSSFLLNDGNALLIQGGW